IDDEDRGDCVSGVYHAESERPASQEGVLTVPMAYQGTASLDGRTYTLALHKVYLVTKRDPAVEVAYAIANQAAVPCAIRFGVELNLTLLAGNDPQRYYEMPDRGRVRLHERGQCPATDRFPSGGASGAGQAAVPALSGQRSADAAGDPRVPCHRGRAQHVGVEPARGREQVPGAANRGRSRAGGRWALRSHERGGCPRGDHRIARSQDDAGEPVGEAA